MSKIFKKIYLEITSRCNLACDFCIRTQRPAASMDRALFQQTLRQIKGYTRHIRLHVLGEPLLHPAIGDFLDDAHRGGYLVNLTTNGTLLDSRSDDILTKPALRQVSISLHCAQANSTLPAEPYMDGIIRFLCQARRRPGMPISLRLWDRGGRKRSDTMQTMLGTLEAHFSLPYSLSGELARSNSIQLAENIFLNQAQRFSWPDINGADRGGSGFCHALRDHAAILVDGTVVPCCLDGAGIIDLGTVQHKSFHEIMEGDRAQRIYEGFSQRRAVEPLCRRCTYRSRFDRSCGSGKKSIGQACMNNKIVPAQHSSLGTQHEHILETALP